MPTPNDPISPTIVMLCDEPARGSREALATFWRHVIELGTPLVEPIPNDDRHVLVTFLWRGTAETRNVVVVGGVADYDVAEDFVHHQMTHLPNSDVWFRTYCTRVDAHFLYRLSPNDSLVSASDVTNWRAREVTFQPDPLNRHPIYSEDDEHSSIARLPGVTPQPWFEPGLAAARSVEEHEWYSPTLARARTLWIYPPASPLVGSEACRLLLLFDGPSFLRTPAIPIMFDQLYAAGRLPPVLCVNIGYAHNPRYDRDHELSCNPAFVDALAYDLLPWLQQRYQRPFHASETIVGGASLAGLAAAYAALRQPQVFGNVLSQYGFFSWAPPSDDEPTEHEWLAHQFLASPTLPVCFSLNVGMFDNVQFPNHKQRPSLLIANRHLRDILRAKGYQVAYHEFYGGHDGFSELYTFTDALLALCATDAKR